MKFNDPEDECSVLVASDAIGMGLNLWVCQVNCNSYLYKCLSIREVMFTCSDEWLTLETSALSKVYSPWRRVNARNVCLETLNSGQFTFINLVLVKKSNYLVILLTDAAPESLKNLPPLFILTLSLPWVTKTEFLLTISIQYQADKWWE